MRDKHTRMSCSMFSRDLYLVFIAVKLKLHLFDLLYNKLYNKSTTNRISTPLIRFVVQQVVQQIHNKSNKWSLSITAENAVSHRYVVANGNKTLTAFSDSSGYSQERLIQNDISDILLNCKRKDLSDDSSASSCSRPIYVLRLYEDRG